MSKKDFLKMTPEERDAEARKWERGIDFDETRPMSERSQALWETAKRGRGRPRKPASERAKRVLISLDPNVFALVETFASARGLDRSKLFAVSVQAFIAAEKALEQTSSTHKRPARPRTAKAEARDR